MTTIRNFTDADGREVQPYFAAFMLEYGFTRRAELFERDGHGHEYILWNSARWREYRDLLGIDENKPISRQARAEFTDFLQARVDRVLGKEAA